MTAKALLVIGLIWFVAAAAWLRFSPGFSFVWMLPKGGLKQAAVGGAIYLALISYTFLLIGWVVPLLLGVYRLVAKR